MFELAEPIPGPSTEALAKLARDLKVVIIGSLFERRAAGIYHNTAVILDADGSLLGKYRKMHIPDDPLYYEKFYFTPGDLGFPNFDTKFGRIGVLVCWDQWYPEGARLASLGGANIIFYPTAIGWHPSEKQEFGAAQLDAWRTIQRSHAIANGVFVAAVNRVGFEGPPESGLEFWGHSFVSDPFGRVLAEGSADKEEILIVECDPKRSRRRAATGRSSATAASMPTPRSWSDGTSEFGILKFNAPRLCRAPFDAQGKRVKPPREREYLCRARFQPCRNASAEKPALAAARSEPPPGSLE